MKRVMAALAACTLILGNSACKQSDAEAESPAEIIAGDWVIDLNSAKWENDVSEYLLIDGTFRCQSCEPPYEMLANGEWQKIDRPGTDAVMMEVVDATTFKSAGRHEGEDTGHSIWTVSEDGTSMEINWTNLRGSEPISGVSKFIRSEAAPDGAHAISGKWATAGISKIDEAGLRFSFSIDGDYVTNSGNGTGYTAQLGGEAVILEGDDSGIMVSIEKLEDGRFLETFFRDGETLSTTEITVEADRLTGVSKDSRDGSVVRWSATRQ